MGKKINIVKLVKEELQKQLNEMANSFEELNLTDAEIGLLVALYNKYGGEEGVAVDKQNYQFIQPDFAADILNKYITDTNASDNGKLLAKNVLHKFQGK